MKRRTLLAASLAAPWHPAAAQAQQRVAWVSVFPLQQVKEYLAAFRTGLAAQGFAEGRNLVLDAVSADGDPRQLPAVVDAVVRRRPAVIVSQGGAIFEVRRVTDIPVVFGFSGDPVKAGLTDSLARPSRNLTGVTFMAVDLNGKRIELLREVSPMARDVMLMGDPVHPGVELEVEASQATAERLGLRLRWAPTRTVHDVRDQLASVLRDPVDGLVVLPDSVMLQSRADVSAFAARHLLPSISGWSSFARAGGLLTYGPHLESSFARLAYHAARILQGTPPSQLPVERPTRFELVANLRAAAAIGRTLPLSIIARADEVIE